MFAIPAHYRGSPCHNLTARSSLAPVLAQSVPAPQETVRTPHAARSQPEKLQAEKPLRSIFCCSSSPRECSHHPRSTQTARFPETHLLYCSQTVIEDRQSHPCLETPARV